MTWNMDFGTETTIHATGEEVMGVLADVEGLPAWNPAFTWVGPQQDDGAHSLIVQRVLRGSIRMTKSGATVDYAIEIPGLVEHSTFRIDDNVDGTTRVTHRVQQAGPLSRLIGAREASLVPGKRLDRLERVLAGTY